MTKADVLLGLQWGDINWQERSLHLQRNVVKVTGEDIIVKETKTVAGDRYVYFSLEMESLLKESAAQQAAIA